MKALIFSLVFLSSFAYIFSISTHSNTSKQDTHQKSPREILPLSQVRVGMHGYGLSVFYGTVPERFHVHILSILEAAALSEGPRSRLILARFSGANLEHTGVVAGMSGSPVYIDGKLVGAVSHAFPRSKDPIGAIRPIEEMLPVLHAHAHDKNTQIQFIDKQFGVLTPLAIPVILHGAHARIFDSLQESFESAGSGFAVLKNAVGGALVKGMSEGISQDLRPGDAVGIPLVTGDMNIASVGTVTYKKGDKVLLYGHPAFFRGPLAIPMSKAYVHAVIPSKDIAFKLASSLFKVGTIYNDQYSAVAGRLGAYPKALPLRVEVRIGGARDRYSYQIVQDKVLLPNLLAGLIMNSVFHTSDTSAYTSIKMRFDIKLQNQRTGEINTISIEDFFTGEQTEKQLFKGFMQLDFPVRSIAFNPFVEAELLSIDAKIDLRYGIEAAELTKIKILKHKLRAGDEIPLLLTLRNYQGEETHKKVSIRIPQTIRGEEIILGVSNGKVAGIIDKTLSEARFIPQTYAQLLKILNYEHKMHDLVVWLDIPRQGLIIRGKELGNLPSSMLSVLGDLEPLGMGDKRVTSRVHKVYHSKQLIYGILSRRIKLED